jgi:hypothetical protein
MKVCEGIAQIYVYTINVYTFNGKILGDFSSKFLQGGKSQAATRFANQKNDCGTDEMGKTASTFWGTNSTKKRKARMDFPFFCHVLYKKTTENQAAKTCSWCRFFSIIPE